MKWTPAHLVTGELEKVLGNDLDLRKDYTSD